MCCFSQPVEHVSKTNLFARASGERQLLAYSMDVAARAAVAMILPLPVPANGPEDAVRFIDLSGYPGLFAGLSAMFPPMFQVSLQQEPSRGPSRQALVVHEVGAFVASFVPRLADFDRLDRRFRLSDEVWRSLPQYADWGFAVFMLKDLGGGWRFWRRPTKTIHPMALEFPRRSPAGLFFPTVHVHDGAVHAKAAFDHTLYYQAERALAGEVEGIHETSEDPAGRRIEVGRCAGLIDAAARVHRWVVVGERANRDVVLR